jgi:hypothetical protein
MLLSLEIVKTVLLLLITVFTAYTARQLYQANKDKAKAALREKRLGIYNEVMRILTLVARDGDIVSEELQAFRSRTHESGFLFEQDVADYINDIYARSQKLRSTNSLLKSASLPIGEDRDNITVENSKQLIWLADQLPYVKKKFEKYLGASSGI